MKNIIIMSFFLIFFIACGNNATITNDDENLSTNLTNINVPKKLDIKIPNALKGNRSEQSNKSLFQKTSDSTFKSRGYLDLQYEIEKAEKFILETNEFFIKYQNMMQAIVEACDGTNVNEQCTIIEPQFTTLTINKILYTRNDNTHTFQHNVTLHFPIEADLIKNLETLNWSEDNNFIRTIKHRESPYDKGKMELDYQKKDDGSYYLKTLETFGAIKYEYGQYTFSIEDTNDINKTIKIKSNDYAIYAGVKDAVDIKSSIDNKGGYLSYKQTSVAGNHIEKETFNSTGKLLQTTFCYPDESTCKINDESTWETYSVELGVNNENPEDLFPDNNQSIFDFSVTGGVLYLGSCELFPPNFEIDPTISVEDLLSNVVAAIVQEDEKYEGIMYDTSYFKDLNSLKIICFTNTDTTEYIELTGDDRPLLTPYQSNTN